MNSCLPGGSELDLFRSAMKMKSGKFRSISVVSMPRSASSCSIQSNLYNVGEKQKIKEMFESGSSSKVRQTFQMILMVVIPIIALLSITAVTLISALETSSQANKAKHQIKLILQVRE